MCKEPFVVGAIISLGNCFDLTRRSNLDILASAYSGFEAVAGGVLKGSFPAKGLRYPKEEEKEPFRTFAEIEAIIASENPDEERKEALWQALYLTRPELEEFLGHMRLNATLPWL